MPRQSNALCNRPSLQLLLDDTENDIICVDPSTGDVVYQTGLGAIE